MKKGLIAGLGCLCMAGIIVVFFSAFAGKPKEYMTESAKQSAIAENVEVSGDIKGEYYTTYYAEVSAPISEYSLNVGDTVLANQPVVAYDISDLSKVLEQAILNAESTENSMNGQIAASNKNASLYNKAVNDSNVYMGLYAIARYSNDQINQSQYQENWDIANTSKSIEGQIAEKNKTIANKTAEVNEKTEKLLKLTPGSTEYNDTSDELNKLKDEITGLNKDIACLSGNLAALPPAMLNPEENAKETVNNNWMQDITRNWTESTTVKNTYEGQILNSYQKQQLQNSCELSELSVVNAQDDIEKASRGVNADFNGIVTESYIEKGAVVTKGMPLFTIESSDDLRVLVGISKYDIGKIELGQRASIKIAGHEYDGSVSEVKRYAQVTDSDKAKVEVSVKINNPDQYVYLGLEADVIIYANEVASALVIPFDGYYADDAGDYCYVIKDGIIEKKYITVGITSDEYVQVISGINAGDVIITDSITDDSIGQKAISK